MEKLIKEEKINYEDNNYLHLIYIQYKSKKYLDIYNVSFNKVYYVTRIDTSYFYSGITYKVNSNYLMIYQYRPIIGSELSYITNIFKFYDLKDNINIVDTVKNLVLKIGDNKLLYDPKYYNNNCYPYSTIELKTKNKLLDFQTLRQFKAYLMEIRAYANGIEVKKQDEPKLIDLDSYLEQSSKVLSLGGLSND